MNEENPCEGCLVTMLCTDMCERVKPFFFGKVKVGTRIVKINTKDTLYGDAAVDQISEIKFEPGQAEKNILELKEKYCGANRKQRKKKK